MNQISMRIGARIGTLASLCAGTAKHAISLSVYVLPLYFLSSAEIGLYVLRNPIRSAKTKVCCLG